MSVSSLRHEQGKPGSQHDGAVEVDFAQAELRVPLRRQGAGCVRHGQLVLGPEVLGKVALAGEARAAARVVAHVGLLASVEPRVALRTKGTRARGCHGVEWAGEHH